MRGGRPGDLYVVIVVKEHPIFTRQGDDIYCEVPVSFTPGGSGRANRDSHHLRANHVEDPAGDPDRGRVPPARERVPERAGVRSRRSAGPDLRGGPDAPVGQAAGPAGAVCRLENGEGSPVGPGILGEGQGPLRVRPDTPWDARITDDSSFPPRRSGTGRWRSVPGQARQLARSCVYARATWSRSSTAPDGNGRRG